jgi:hypothetical protein
MARHDFDPTTITPDGRPPAKTQLFDGTSSGPHRGSVNGEILGAQVTVLAYGNDETVSGGAKVGQWSGGVVPLRGGVITGHWLG